MGTFQAAGLEPALRPAPLSKQVADSLRRAIIHGTIPAGTRLTQDELCKEFGTSRMPVRDALRQLTHEGLLREVGAQREVVPFAAEAFAESQELIAVLHGWATRRVAERGTDEEIAELRAVHDEMVAATSSAERSQLGYRFHTM